MKTQHTKHVKTGASVDEMSLYEICRWAALKDAVDVIGDKCDEKSINFDSFASLKSLDILNYVDSLTDTYYEKATKTI